MTPSPTFGALMRAYLWILLLLAPALRAEHWSAESLLNGVPGFKAGAAVVDAPDGGNGIVYESETLGSIALEGKPGKIWRFHHTFFYTEEKEMLRSLAMTVRVVVNATGMDRKEAARAIGRAIATARRSESANNRFELAGRVFYAAHKKVLNRSLVMLSLQALPEGSR